MPINKQSLSEMKETNIPSAAELFTDREDPQEAFERKFRLLKKYRKEAFGVLCYYGIGGIGKTSFMNKMIRLMDHKDGVNPILQDEIDGYYARFDFGAEGIEKDKTTMLVSIRNQLVEKNPRFKFVLFDTARLFYLKKLGVDVNSDKEMSFIIEKNVWLKSAVNLLGAMPVVGWMSNAAQAIDGIIAGINEKSEENNKKYRRKLNIIRALEPSEIIDRMHEFFAEDLRINVSSNIDKLIVVFLDTYERFIDNLNSDTIRMDSDYWLRRGNSSLIKSVPGILWVIMGREKMDWRKDDSDWDDEVNEDIPISGLSENDKEELANNNLEQHLLGDLSESDSIQFFQKAGIYDTKLCHELYELTSGTPLYMDICVRNYYALGKENVNIEQFGNDINELINRYMKNMPYHYRQMLFVMSILEEWNDEKFEKVAYALKNNEWFTTNRYNDFIKHSFIISNSSGRKYVHETVRKACMRLIEPSFIRETHKVSLLNRDGTDELVIDTLFSGADYEESILYWPQIVKLLDINEDKGKFENNVVLLENMYYRVRSVFPDSEYQFIIESRLAYWIDQNGRSLQAWKIIEETQAQVNSYINSENPLVLRAIIDLVHVFRSNKRTNRALRISLDVQEKLCKLIGFNNVDTLYCTSTIGILYAELGDIKESIRINQKVCAKRKELLGEIHPSTINSLFNLGVDYSSLGELDKALDIFFVVYKARSFILGDDHVRTIDVLIEIADIYIRKEEYDKGLNYIRQAESILKEKYGENNSRMISLIECLGRYYSAQNRQEEALGLYNSLYYKLSKNLGEDDPESLHALYYTARAYYNTGNNSEAIRLYWSLYEKRKKVLGCNNRTFDALVCILNIYIEQNDNENAWKIVDEIFKFHNQIDVIDVDESVQVLDRIYKIHMDIGRYENALEIAKEIYEIKKSIYGEDDFYTAVALMHMAACYLEMDDYTKAIELNTVVYDIFRRSEGENSNYAKDQLKLIEEIKEYQTK